MSPRISLGLCGPLNITLVKKIPVNKIDAFLLHLSPVRPPADEQVAQPTRVPGALLPTPFKSWGTTTGLSLLSGTRRLRGPLA